MYFYFNKDKYLISTRKHPYISSERIKHHNSLVIEVEQLTKEAAELNAVDEKYKAVISVALCVMLVIVVCVVAINLHLEILIPFSVLLLGAWGMISENLPTNSDLRLLESVIKEKTEYLNNELHLFEESKKRQAQHWLSMSGHLFEKEVAKLFEAQGYEAQVTKGSGDGGIDIFLKKDGLRYGVQCKNHHGVVGPAAIRDLYGAMTHEKLDEGIFIASTGYTVGAKEFANNKHIQLLDINNVISMHVGSTG